MISKIRLYKLRTECVRRFAKHVGIADVLVQHLDSIVKILAHSRIVTQTIQVLSENMTDAHTVCRCETLVDGMSH